MPNDTPTTSIQRAQPSAGAAVRAYQPATFAELTSMAEMLSRSGLVPDALRGKPADVATIIMHGASLGIDAMASIRSIHCVKGKPVLSADLQVALCVRHDDVCESFRVVESTDEVASYEAKRRGQEPVRLSWTKQQADRAGLSGDNWRKYPAAMLRARCAAALARAVFPDLVAGLYDPEELGAEAAPPPVDVTPTVCVEIAQPAPALNEPPTVTEPPAASVPSVTTDPVDPATAWIERVRATTTLDALTAVATDLKAANLDKPVRDRVASAFIDHKRALSNGGGR